MANTFKFDDKTMKIIRNLGEFYGTNEVGTMYKAIGLLELESVFGPFYTKDENGVEHPINTKGGTNEVHEDQVPEQEQERDNG